MKFRALSILSLATSLVAGQSFCSNSSHSGQSVKVTSNKVGSIGNIGYELWADSGNNSATFYSDGSFSCSFNNAKDYLCRTGLSFDSTKTHDQIGHMYADFKLVKQNIRNVDYSYVGIYGWSRNPLVEYYIVDNWLSQWRPGDWVGNKKHGDFMIDGAMYTVYENTRNGPSIDGNTTFKQFFSIRQTARDCGTIDITAHFQQWEKLGMKLGKMHEAKVLGEAGSTGSGTSGTADFPYAKVYIGNGGNQNTAAKTVPRTSNAKTIPKTTSAGVKTIPKSSSGKTIPVTSAGKTIPVSSSGKTIPKSSSGKTIPVTSAGKTIPVSSSGKTIPVSSSGKTIPVSSGKTIPVSSGKTIPVSSGKTIPVSSGKTIPVSSGKTIPVSSGKTIPVSSGKTIPVSSGKTIPVSSGKTIPVSSGKTIPVSSGKTIPVSSGKTIPSSGVKTIPNQQTSCKAVTVTVNKTVTVTVTERQQQPTNNNQGGWNQGGWNQGGNNGNCAAKWGQCGGNGFSGPTCCQQGSSCQFVNEWYSQCL